MEQVNFEYIGMRTWKILACIQLNFLVPNSSNKQCSQLVFSMNVQLNRYMRWVRNWQTRLISSYGFESLFFCWFWSRSPVRFWCDNNNFCAGAYTPSWFSHLKQKRRRRTIERNDAIELNYDGFDVSINKSKSYDVGKKRDLSVIIISINFSWFLWEEFF